MSDDGPDQWHYSVQQIRKIGEDLWAKVGKDIEWAAREYLQESRLESFRPRSDAVRGELEAVARSSRHLIDAVSQLSDDALDELAGGRSREREGEQRLGMRLTPPVDVELTVKRTPKSDLLAIASKLPELLPKLDEIATKYTKGRREKHLPRYVFVKALAHIYEKGGQGRPTRRHDGHKGRDYGPFREFVLACLEPLDPEAVRGIDDVIRKVATSWEPKR